MKHCKLSMKKLLALLMALVLVSATLAVASAEVDFSAFDWEIPAETVTITYYDGQELPESCAKKQALMHEFMLKYFNIDLQRIVFENDVEERLSMMAVSGDYPDVITCMTPSQAADWYDQGRAIDMKPYVDKLAPNFVEQLGDLYKRFVTKDDVMYAMPNIWGLLEIADYAPRIRYDWWVDAGQKDFTTPDEYFETLRSLVEAHPTNAAGEKTYALSFIKGRRNYELAAAMWGLKQGWKEDVDHNLIFFPGTEEGWEMTKCLNRFNVEGLLDPDSFVMTMDEWVQKLAAERYAGILDAWWPCVYTQTYWPETVENYDPQTDLYVHRDVHIEELTASTINPKNANGTYRTIVTDKCANPEIIAKLINFEHTDLGLKLLGWGVPEGFEGIVKGSEEDYAGWRQTDTEAGWEYVQERIDEIVANSFNSARFDYLGGNVHFTMDQRYQPDKSNSWYDQNFNDKIWWRGYMNENMASSCFDWSAFLAIEIPVEDDISMQWQQIKDVVSSMFVEAVLAPSEEECRVKYDEMVKKVNALGMDEVNEWFSEQYKIKLTEWGMM